jgi:hypothetical protein
MEIKSWLEIDANWKLMPPNILKEFENLLSFWNIKKESNKKCVGSKDDLFSLAYDVAEEISNSKKFFKKIEVVVRGQEGTYRSDMLGD